MQTKPSYGNQFRVRSVLPKAPPVPEEPTEKMPKSPLACQICGKVFHNHSALDRHMESIHGNPEKTHTAPHL